MPEKSRSDAQRLSRSGGYRHLGGFHGFRWQRRKGRLGWGDGCGRLAQPIEQSRQDTSAHGLGQHMGYALQVGFFLPLRLLGGGVDDNRAPRGLAAQLLHHPNPLNAGEFNVNDADLGQTVLQQRLCLIHVAASDHTVVPGIDSLADRFCEIRMFGQHQ